MGQVKAKWMEDGEPEKYSGDFVEIRGRYDLTRNLAELEETLRKQRAWVAWYDECARLEREELEDG